MDAPPPTNSEASGKEHSGNETLTAQAEKHPQGLGASVGREMPNEEGWWIKIVDLNPHLYPQLRWVENWRGDWMQTLAEPRTGLWSRCESGKWFRLPLECLAQSCVSPTKEKV